MSASTLRRIERSSPATSRSAKVPYVPIPALLTRRSIGIGHVAEARLDDRETRVVEEVGRQQVASTREGHGARRRSSRADRRRARRARRRRRAPRACRRRRARCPADAPGDERGGHAERCSTPATASTVAATASPTCTSVIARSGSFSPWPVTVHTTMSSGATQTLLGRLEQPGHRRRRRRLHEATLLGGEQPVAVEDLGVADRADVAARLVAGGDRARPTTPGCRCGSRWRSSRGAGRARRTRSAPSPPPATRACAGTRVARPSVVVLAVAAPVGGDVAGVADREGSARWARRPGRRRSRTRPSSVPRCGTGSPSSRPRRPDASPSSRTMWSASSKLPWIGTSCAPWMSACASLPSAMCPAGSTHRARRARRAPA